MISAAIYGCEGPVLGEEERRFFRDVRPWGFILFRRNVESPDQVRALVAALRDAVGRADSPILIDQEGGRVQRLRAPHWPAYPPASAYLKAAGGDPLKARDLVRLGARLIAHDLHGLGITVNCMPVADTPVPGAHDIIGDRAYASDPAVVTQLSRAAAEGLIAGGVLPVMKHMPGHGRATADSHHALPVVSAPLKTLDVWDFAPFRALSDMPVAMTAHVVFEAMDRKQPATTSKKALRLMRDRPARGGLGFGGLIVTDDLSMNALSGSLRERAEASLRAGCDIVLHCNGVLNEMRSVAEGTGRLKRASAARAQAALARLPAIPEPLDEAAARSRFQAALDGRMEASAGPAAGEA